MKKIFLIFSILFLFISCSRDVNKISTSAGGNIFVFNDPTIPLINIRIIIQSAGAIRDPASKNGLADLTANLLTKGTMSFPKSLFEEKLDSIGAELSISAETDGVIISGRFLKKYHVKYFTLLKSLLTEPLFDEKEFKLEIERRKNFITTALKDDNFLLEYYSSKYWYRNHPYSNMYYGTPKSLSNISVEDVRSFFETFYAENTILAGISGDLSDGSVVPALRKTIESIKNKKGKVPKTPLVPYNKGSALYVIDKPHRTENKLFIVFNTRDFTIANPEILKFNIANDYFGGGELKTVLMSELREKKGYVYSTYSFFDLEGTSGGNYKIYANPHAKKIGHSISLILNLFKDYIQNGISSIGMEQQRKHFTNRFPFNFETTKKKMTRFVMQRFYRMPLDYDKNYLDNVKRYTAHEIRHIMRDMFLNELSSYQIFVVAEAESLLRRIKAENLKFNTIKIIPYDEILRD